MGYLGGRGLSSPSERTCQRWVLSWGLPTFGPGGGYMSHRPKVPSSGELLGLKAQLVLPGVMTARPVAADTAVHSEGTQLGLRLRAACLPADLSHGSCLLQTPKRGAKGGSQVS